MKNTYIKKTRISTRKFRLLIKYFCMELTALQIAELLQINRNTANLWINKIRERISLIVEKEKLTNADCVQMDETFFTRTKEYFPKWKLPHEEVVVFGMINSSGKVYASLVDKVNRACIFPVILGCCISGATIFTDGGSVYKGLSKVGFEHHTISHVDKEFARKENGITITTNRIEGFWGWMKVRLAKFRGVKWSCLSLHIAESVWRYNHRQDDIYKLLLKELRVRPLNFN